MLSELLKFIISISEGMNEGERKIMNNQISIYIS